MYKRLFDTGPRALFSLVVFVLSGTLLVGCAGGGLVVYPSSSQDDPVSTTTRSGYTLLRSTKGNTSVAVSLRAATSSYVQSYVSIENRGSAPVTIRPSKVRVVTSGQRDRTFSAYPPSSVPNIVQQSALSSEKFVLGLDNSAVTSSAITGAEEKSASESSGYGRSAPSSDRSYMELMLQEQPISPQGVATGLVYTPFNRTVNEFRLEIPLADQTHVFHFTVRKQDG